MSEQSHPQDDHWFSLMSQLGLTPPESERGAAREAERSAEATVDVDRVETSAAPPSLHSASGEADDRSSSEAQNGPASLFDQEDAGEQNVQSASFAEACSESVPAATQLGRDSAQCKPLSEPRPTTDWDLLAEELGIAPAKEAENTSAAAPTSETAAGEDYVATPQRVQQRIEVFERRSEPRAASTETAFGEGLLWQPTAESPTEPDRSESEQKSAHGGVFDLTESTDSERVVANDEENRPPRDGKKRKRRRRKAKASRSGPESRTSPSDVATSEMNEEAEPLDSVDAEPEWIDREEESELDATDERSVRGPRPSRDSRGEPRKAPPAEEPSRPARVRGERNDDDSFDDEAEDDELRPAHKQIPTWEQAVGCIIQANIEARSRRGESSRNRGRPSGRR